MNLVETRDLAIGYGDKILVNNINFRLQEKQICCLLGANGAGKSTFLKTLLGLQAPLQGGKCIGGNVLYRITAKGNWRATLLMCRKLISIYSRFWCRIWC